MAHFVASLGALPLAHQPGEVWEYSWSADVLARVVEVASGQSFDEFLQGRIFGPLQMIDTGFHVPETKLTRLVAPPPGGRLAVWDVTKAPALFSGGGGLVSTVRDNLQFCRMLLKNGELNGVRILSPQTVKRMTSNALPADIRFANEMIEPALGATWGLGFAITTDPTRFPGSIGSVSWSGVWGTFFWIDFTENIKGLSSLEPGRGRSASGKFVAPITEGCQMTDFAHLIDMRGYLGAPPNVGPSRAGYYQVSAANASVISTLRARCHFYLARDEFERPVPIACLRMSRAETLPRSARIAGSATANLLGLWATAIGMARASEPEEFFPKLTRRQPRINLHAAPSREWRAKMRRDRRSHPPAISGI